MLKSSRRSPHAAAPGLDATVTLSLFCAPGLETWRPRAGTSLVAPGEARRFARRPSWMLPAACLAAHLLASPASAPAQPGPAAARRPAAGADRADPSPGSNDSPRGAPPRVILLESHAQEPLGHERHAIDAVITSLGPRALSRDALATHLDAAFGRRSQEVSEARRQALLASLRDAAQATYLGDWARATRLLTWVRRELSDDVLGQARQRPLFDALQQARILLAECHARNHRRRQAWLLMEEALRAQPDLSLSPTLYGPALQALHFRVKSQLDLRRASLRVETTPPGALLFLSGRHVGISPVLLTGLYHGTYELLALHGAQVSRIRRLHLNERPAHVRIDLPGEAPLRTGREVGLVLPRGSEREGEERRWAEQIGRKLGAERLILLGIQDRQGRRALVGRILAGRPHQTRALAYVFLEPTLPTRKALHRLGEFLIHGGTPGREVEVIDLGLPPLPKDTTRAPRARPHRGLWIAGWSLVASGLATSAGGGAALLLDGRTGEEATSTTPRMVYRTGRLGYGLLGGGLGVALLGVALLVVDVARGGSPGPGPGPRPALGSSTGPGAGPDRRSRPRFGVGTDGRSLLLSVSGAL